MYPLEEGVYPYTYLGIYIPRYRTRTSKRIDIDDRSIDESTSEVRRGRGRGSGSKTKTETETGEHERSPAGRAHIAPKRVVTLAALPSSQSICLT